MAARKTTRMIDAIRDTFPKREYAESTCFAIYSMQFASYLMMHHLKLRDIQQDRQNATRTVFFLLEEPKLHRLMQQYMTKHK